MGQRESKPVSKFDGSIGRLPDRFVAAALERGWFGESQLIPKPVVQLIANYYCVPGYEWSHIDAGDDTGFEAIGPRLSSKPGEIELTIADCNGSDERSMCSNTRIGEAGRASYFAVRLSQIKGLGWNSATITIGVQTKPRRHPRTAQMSVGRTIGVANKRLKGGYTVLTPYADERVVLTIGKGTSRQCGYMNDDVVGVVYDRAAGSFTYYVNDTRVYSLDAPYRYVSFALEDEDPPPGYYAYLGLYGMSLRAELVDGWHPPPPPPHDEIDTDFAMTERPLIPTPSLSLEQLFPLFYFILSVVCLYLIHTRAQY